MIIVFTSVVLCAFGGAFTQNESANARLLAATIKGSVGETSEAIQAGANANIAIGKEGATLKEVRLRLR